MDMDWVAISALAVAAVTLYLVFRQELRQRRNAPFVDLSLHCLGDAHEPTTGAVVGHIWDFVNQGTADARVWGMRTFGCESKPIPDIPPIRVIKAGESARLMVEPCDQRAAWVFIGWNTPHDKRGCYFQWLAPDPSPELVAAIHAGSPAVPSWLRWIHPTWLRRQLYKVRAVGPGGVTEARVHIGTRRTQRQLLAALSLAMPEVRPEDLLPPMTARPNRSRSGS